MPMRYFGLAAKVSGPLGDGRHPSQPRQPAALAACRPGSWLGWATLWLDLAKPLLAAAHKLTSGSLAPESYRGGWRAIEPRSLGCG